MEATDDRTHLAGCVQTGDDIEAAVLYPEDARYLVGGESTVTHYQVIDQVSA